MSAAKLQTLYDVADRHLRLRAWCYCCGRHVEFDGRHVLAYFIYRNWPPDLASARRAFKCDTCLLGGHILLVPSSQPPEKPMTWEREVAAFFHANRRAGKGRGSVPGDRSIEIEWALQAAAQGKAAHWVPKPMPIERR